MPLFNGDIIFLDASGQIIARDGDLTIRADDSGERAIIVGSGRSLRPERDLYSDLGTLDARWLQVNASGANVNRVDALFGKLGPIQFWDILPFFAPNGAVLTSCAWSWSDAQLVIGPDASLTVQNGSPVSINGEADFFGQTKFWNGHIAFVNGISGTVFPFTNLGHALGTPSQRWSLLHAASGFLNVLSPQTSGTFLEIQGSIIPDQSMLRSLGSPTRRWSNVYTVSGAINLLSIDEINVGETLTFGGDPSFITQVSNLNWDAGGANITFSSLDQLDMTDSNLLILTNLDAKNIDTQDASFVNRPTVSNSGVLVQRENYFEVFGGTALNFGSTSGPDQLLTGSNNLAFYDWGFVLNEDVQLRHYALQVTHLNGSQPNPWAIRLRINDQTNDHASGVFPWHPISGAIGTHVGTMSGTQTIRRGSRVQLSIDSNGNPAHEAVFVKAWLGFTVVSGLSQ